MISSSKSVHRTAAFTLIELMVSIAIVVVLMVGVAQVFQYTGQAVGANQQMSDAVRNDRAIQSTLTNEIQSIAPDSPVLLIRSVAGYAFRNKADQAADKDGDPGTWEQRTADTGAGSTIFGAEPNERNHRLDRLGFMARGSFPRQTGNEGVFVAPQSSNEAFVWYGHLCLPHTNGNFYLDGATIGTKTNPAAGTAASNPQNYFASQWVLGRVGHLLIEPTGAVGANPGSIAIGSGASAVLQDFITRSNTASFLTNQTPLSDGATSTQIWTGTANFQARDCRYDLAGTSIQGFANILRSVLGSEWQPGLNYVVGQRVSYRGYSFTVQQAHTSGLANAPVLPFTGFTQVPQWTADAIPVSDWWADIFMSERYECNPFVIKPLSSQNYSQQAPVFAQGCSQFIVEYAGDFLRQETDPNSRFYGYVLDSFDNPVASPLPHTDGETDFIVTWTDTNTNGLIDPAEASTVKRSIRWYGLPRDVDGDGIVRGYNDATGTVPQNLVDVIPFRDVAMTINTTANLGAPFNTMTFPPNAAVFYDPSNNERSYRGAPFERFIFQGGGAGTPLPSFPSPFYMNRTADPGNATGMPDGFAYQCAWGPYEKVRPKYIRITITLDDPNSRFAEGQTFQYVFKLP